MKKNSKSLEEIFSTAHQNFKKKNFQAAEMLSESGLSVAVVNMHTIKPIDFTVIDKACETTKLLVTIEEHSVIGGLGSAVAEYKSTLVNTPPQFTIGIPDTYSKAGEYADLLQTYGLASEQIAENIAAQYEILYS